jgi:lysine 2,3-aminomutase
MPSNIAKQSELNQRYAAFSAHERLLPVKVTRFFQKKIDEEVTTIGNNEGPLHRIAYPTQERLTVHTKDEVVDFVDDRSNMPDNAKDVLIHKYADRLLFMPTASCIGHCQYCFRQDVLSDPLLQKNALDHKLEILSDYLAKNRDITEVILSGGDPMSLAYTQLEKIISCLQNIPQVESIRLHTKTISYAPQVFTDEKMKLLGDARVRLVFHIVHPYELCDEVTAKIKELQQHGIRCYNQFPLLRNINDHVDVLIKLLKLLDDLNVRNLSMFVAEPVKYSASYRISLPRLFSLLDELNWRTPSWINSTRFALDTPIGKVRREDLQSYDAQTRVAIFKRQCNEVRYQDFPQELDIPGELTTLLWKD